LEEQKQTNSTANHRNSSKFNETKNLIVLLNSVVLKGKTPPPLATSKVFPSTQTELTMRPVKPNSTDTERNTTENKNKAPKEENPKK